MKMFAKPLLKWIEWDISVLEEMERQLLSPISSPPSSTFSSVADVDANVECRGFRTSEAPVK